MTFNELCTRIESLEFAAIMSVASTRSGFLSMLRQQPEFHLLIEAASEDRSAIVIRIAVLVRRQVDKR